MSAFDQEDRLLEFALAGMGITPEPELAERITGKPFLQRLGELATEAGALGLWETTRTLARLQGIAVRELRHAGADELAPSTLHRKVR